MSSLRFVVAALCTLTVGYTGSSTDPFKTTLLDKAFESSTRDPEQYIQRIFVSDQGSCPSGFSQQLRDPDYLNFPFGEAVVLRPWMAVYQLIFCPEPCSTASLHIYSQSTLFWVEKAGSCHPLLSYVNVTYNYLRRFGDDFLEKPAVYLFSGEDSQGNLTEVVFQGEQEIFEVAGLEFNSAYTIGNFEYALYHSQKLQTSDSSCLRPRPEVEYRGYGATQFLTLALPDLVYGVGIGCRISTQPTDFTEDSSMVSTLSTVYTTGYESSDPSSQTSTAITEATTALFTSQSTTDVTTDVSQGTTDVTIFDTTDVSEDFTSDHTFESTTDVSLSTHDVSTEDPSTPENGVSSTELNTLDTSASTTFDEISLPSTKSTVTNEDSTGGFPSTLSTTVETTQPSTMSLPIDSTSTPNTPMTDSPVLCEDNESCFAIDKHRLHWSACRGATVWKNCSTLEKFTNATGRVRWSCNDYGRFLSEQPIYENCSSYWLEEEEYKSTLVNDTTSALYFLNGLVTEMKILVNGNTEARYFGHEIHNLTEIVNRVIAVAASDPTAKAKVFEEVAQSAILVTEVILRFPFPWHELNSTRRSHLATDLIRCIELIVFNSTQKIPNEEGIINFYTGNPSFIVTALVTNRSPSNYNDGLTFPTNDKASHLTLLPGWKQYVPYGKIEVAGILIGPPFANILLPGQYIRLGRDYQSRWSGLAQAQKLLNGDLLSLSIATGIIGQGIQVEASFHHDVPAWGDRRYDIRRNPLEQDEAARATAQCVYWDKVMLKWSTEGCSRSFINREKSVCKCDHLTSFAVLMDRHNFVGEDKGLFLLTMIICPISAICLALTLVILSVSKTFSKERSFVTKNLVASLLVGSILVMFAIDRSRFHKVGNTEVSCEIAGALTHYVFLAAFVWMGMEGWCLYRMVMAVFAGLRRQLSEKRYYVIGYGSPLVIVVPVFIFGRFFQDVDDSSSAYGGELVCWLKNDFILAFALPALIVSGANVCILGMAVRKTLQHGRNRRNGRVGTMGPSYKIKWSGSLGLTSLLGTGWIVGIFLLASPSPWPPLAYMFILLTSAQGILLFVCNIILNEAMVGDLKSRYGSSWKAISSRTSKNNDSKSSLKDSTSVRVYRK